MKRTINSKTTLWFSLLVGLSWLITALATSWWSYYLVDPNLTLFSFPFFVEWQTQMWARAKDVAHITWFYIFLLGVWWSLYAVIVQWMRRTGVQRVPRWVMLTLFGVVLVLFLGHNALSHDIFNYLFNAKMVAVYGANPHVQVALYFAQDPWTRFMHNTHTAAPYGWGWTVVSLVPFLISGGIFAVAYFGMKLVMVLGFGLYLWAIWRVLQQRFPQSAIWRWSLVAFHPLLLIETLLVGHNDVWMMWPAVLAMSWLCCRKSSLAWWKYLGAGALFAFSISIKLATVVLLPFLIWWMLPKGCDERIVSSVTGKKFAAKFLRFVRRYQADLAALLMLIPLMTPRAQQFHPWYFIWVLTFVPMVRAQWWRAAVLGLSITSTFRYVPLMFAGWEYSPLIQLQMRGITWSGFILGLVTWATWKVVISLRARK